MPLYENRSLISFFEGIPVDSGKVGDSGNSTV